MKYFAKAISNTSDRVYSNYFIFELKAIIINSVILSVLRKRKAIILCLDEMSIYFDAFGVSGEFLLLFFLLSKMWKHLA